MARAEQHQLSDKALANKNTGMIFKRLSSKTKVILTIQSISMLGGASTHLVWSVNNGFLSEKYNAPFFTMVFWDSLTFLDPLAAVLLIVKPKTGLWLTAAIIVVDVFHNSILLPLLSAREYFDVLSLLLRNWMIICQLVFLLFVLLTFKSSMREIKLTMHTKGKGMKLKGPQLSGVCNSGLQIEKVRKERSL